MRPSPFQSWVFGVGCSVLIAASVFAARFGGDAEIAYESVNAYGVSFATNDTDSTILGASIGQGNLIHIGTNDSGQVFLNGFWKAEDGCTLYNPVIVDVQRNANGVGLTFLVVNSNTYAVTYIDNDQQGGLMAGTHAMTNVAVTPFVGEGGAGSTTTVWHNAAASATNAAKFYLIRCE